MAESTWVLYMTHLQKKDGEYYRTKLEAVPASGYTAEFISYYENQKIDRTTKPYGQAWSYYGSVVFSNGTASRKATCGVILPVIDETPPTVEAVNQKSQASSNGWTTINKLDLSGTENYCDDINMSLKKKSNNQIILDNVAIKVQNNKWTYTCTPSLEGSVEGTDYTITVRDKYGNVSSKDFKVYSTDNVSPQVESPLSYTDWTNTAKTITLTFTDYGSGNVQASLGDQTHYQACTKNADGKYQITYTFSDDITGTRVYPLYLKDALGNATNTKLTIGNIDKNTYSISYNLNNGKLSGQPTSYNVTSSFTLPQPTRTGYIFDGWTGSNGTTPQKTVTVNKGTYGNLTYTANWTQTNTINYNAETVYPSWALAKNYSGGSVNITSEVVSGNNTPAGATATAANGFVFDGWYSSSGELITKDATIKPLNCNAEDKGGLIGSASEGKVKYDSDTDTYSITTNAENSHNYDWGSGAYNTMWDKRCSPIPSGYWHIAEFEIWSPIDATCIIDVNNFGAHYTSTNDNDSDRGFSDGKSIFSVKANQWQKCTFWYKNGKNENLYDWSSIGLKYGKSFDSQTFKIRNYKAAVSPTLVKELDTFTARFKPYTHTVAYDANGGTGAPEGFQKCTWTGRKISSTVPTRTGYTFKNWNTKKDGTGTTYNPEQQYVPDINGGTVTLYAQWTVNTYTNIIAHLTGGYKNQEGNNTYKTAFLLGTTTFQSQYGNTFAMDSTKTVKLPNGFYFECFGTTEIDGLYKTYPIGMNITQKADSMIFEYDYQPYDYSITYNLNGGTNNSANPSTYNVLYGISLKAPTKAGYTFTGWYDENGNKVTGINEGCNAKFSSADDLYSKLATRTTGNRTLTAQWAPITWTVKYDANGGSGTMADTKHTYDAHILISNNQFNKTGYTFDGWQASRIRNGKTEWLCANTDNSWISSSEWYETDKIPSDRMIYRWSSHEYSTQTTYIDGDVITLHAQWKPIHYTIKYDANGGAGTMADSTQAYMQHSMTRKNTFTREGWKFLYWYASKQENGITKWIYESPVNYAFGWYEKDKQPSGWHLLKYPDGELSHNATTIDGDVLTFHAQWQYKPVSVKVPQMLIGDHTGKSQFRVKCDDFKAGSIKVTVPSSFPYKQTGKADVTAAITAKSGNNTITPTNKVCIYDITANGLSAGCWQGSFNIGLTLTKE